MRTTGINTLPEPADYQKKDNRLKGKEIKIVGLKNRIGMILPPIRSWLKVKETSYYVL